MAFIQGRACSEGGTSNYTRYRVVYSRPKPPGSVNSQKQCSRTSFRWDEIASEVPDGFPEFVSGTGDMLNLLSAAPSYRSTARQRA